MSDIVLETIRAVILAFLLGWLWKQSTGEFIKARRGWNVILSGFALLLFGSLLDISDNFSSLNYLVVVGDTQTEAFLEKFVGFLGGFSLLAVGFVLWIPKVQQLTRETEERKHAETELDSAQYRAQMILNAVSDGIYGIDEQGRTTFMNPAAVQLVGWMPDELRGKKQHNILHHTKADGSPFPIEECSIYAALQDGKIYHRNDEVFWRKDGSNFPVEYTSMPVWERGKITGAVVTFKDITEQQKTTERLRRSEEYFKNLDRISNIVTQSENVEEMINKIVGEIFTIFKADRAWLLFPCALSAPTFQVPVETTHPKYPGAFTTGVEIPVDKNIKIAFQDALATTEPVSFVFPSGEKVPEFARHFQIQSQIMIAIRPSLGEAWLLGMHQCSHVRHWSDDDKRLLKDIAQRTSVALSNLLLRKRLEEDIAARKKAEWELKELNAKLEERVAERTAALEESHRYNRTLFETSPIGLALCDINGRLVDVNQAYANIVGYTVDEVKDLSYWDITPSNYESKEQVRLQELVKHGRYGPYEKEYLRKDGYRVPVLLNSLTIEQGGELYIWSSVEDITERKRAEQQLQQAKEFAEAANQSKSVFLANMSHEIRTPLNGVLGMLHLLAQTKLEGKQRQFVQTAVGSSELLLTVINDILDFSKMEAGKLELESIEFDPGSLAEETTSLLASGAHHKGLELICIIEPDVPRLVKGDPSRLRQVLTNLISNAIKFTSQGEVVLYMAVHDKNLYFNVIDTGIGLNEVQQHKVFQAFTQADSSHTRKFGGTGLGLAISNRLVAAMGGALRVRSATGQGSEFYFSLPLETVDSGIQQEDASQLLSEQRILVVDDNLVNQIVVKNVLQNWRVKHTGLAANAADALQQLTEAAIVGTPYDLALLDMQMPQTDGLELARSIRSDNNLKHMPLVMLSSLDRSESSTQVDAWLTKPVRQADLRHILLHLLGEQAQQKTNILGQSDNWWFCGRRILLVEDNDTNQEVAQEILSAVGIDIDVRENGEQAIQAVQENDYDAVLMDIQMPVLDGIEATKRIRALGGKYSEIPIIAMTAHAMYGDADKSLAAGMNAHITKPINPEEVFKTLSRWIAPSEQPEEQLRNRHDALNIVPDIDALPQLPGINLVSGLERIRGNWPVYKRILLRFRDKHGTIIDDLEDHVEKGQWETATRLAHTLKGSSGNIGAETLYEKAAAMEHACKQKSLEEVMSGMGGLRQSLTEVIGGLVVLDEEQKQEKNSIEPQGGSIDSGALRLLLDQLADKLDKDLGEAQSCLQTLQANMGGSELKALFEKLEQAVNGFDMDTAKQSIQQMKQKLVA